MITNFVAFVGGSENAMTHKALSRVILVLVILGVCVPVEVTCNGPDLSVNAGDDVTLHCNSTSETPPISEWRNVTWLLPNHTLISRDSERGFANEDGGLTWFLVSPVGDLLTVRNIQKQWYGNYYCLILDSSLHLVATWTGVNTSYYYADELWEEYQQVVIILGVISACVLSALIVFFLMVMWCRKRTPPASESTPSLSVASDLVPDSQEKAVYENYY